MDDEPLELCAPVRGLKPASLGWARPRDRGRWMPR